MLAAPTVFGITGFYSMNAFDFLFWLAALHLVVRLARLEPAQATPSWMALGLVLGFGLLNKMSVLVLGAGVAAVLILTPMRSHLLKRGPWLAAAISLGLFLPHLAWQVQNDWPTAEFIRNASQYKNVSLGPWGFFTSQILDFGPLNAFVWIPGLAWLLFSGRARPVRCLGIVFVVAFLGFMNGKAYYLAPAMLVPLAAGAVLVDGALAPSPHAWPQTAVLSLLLISAAVPLPIVVPLLGAEQVGPYMQAIGIAPKQAERSALGVLPPAPRRSVRMGGADLDHRNRLALAHRRGEKERGHRGQQLRGDRSHQLLRPQARPSHRGQPAQQLLSLGTREPRGHGGDHHRAVRGGSTRVVRGRSARGRDDRSFGHALSTGTGGDLPTAETTPDDPVGRGEEVHLD